MKTHSAKNLVQIEGKAVQLERVQRCEKEVELIEYRPPANLPALVMETGTEILRAGLEGVLDWASRSAAQSRRRRQLRETVRRAQLDYGRGQLSGYRTRTGQPHVEVNVTVNVNR